MEETENKPAAHLSDKHLERLEDGLLEVMSVLGIRGVAVADADLVLVFREEGVGCTSGEHTAGGVLVVAMNGEEGDGRH